MKSSCSFISFVFSAPYFVPWNLPLMFDLLFQGILDFCRIVKVCPAAPNISQEQLKCVWITG